MVEWNDKKICTKREKNNERMKKGKRSERNEDRMNDARSRRSI